MNNKMILPVNAMYIGNYKIIIEFNNGEIRIADLKIFIG
jgi:hypothetical protein